MIDIDDASAVRAADPGGMLDAIASLPAHCEEGYGSAAAVDDLPSADGITSVAYCGMGGSAVSGDIVRSVFRDRLHVPLEVVRTPVLPAYCGPHTLVVCSSYSGNTAETLSCFEEALARGCRIVPVVSGGALAARATEAGVAAVSVPPGFQPRAALGYLTFGALGALERTGLVPQLASQVAETVVDMRELAGRMGLDHPLGDNPAKELAVRIQGRVPVVWGAEGIGSVAAARWKTQMNENAKLPAFASSLPELDHNEVVGWSADAGHAFVVVALRHAMEHPDVSARFPLSLDIALRAGATAEEVWAVGPSPLSQLLSLVLAGDFSSAYLAVLRGIDPTPVDAIERLKRALAER